MIITISGKQMDVTDSMKEIIEEKCQKIDKYFQKDIPITITLSSEKERQIAEATVAFSGVIMRAEESTTDMFASIDGIVDILEKQIRRHKSKLETRNRAGETIRFENVVAQEPEEQGPKIVRNKSFNLHPMDAEEAVLQMELLRHNFFVFLNGNTGNVDIVYKRKDGDYGLIEPEYK